MRKGWPGATFCWDARPYTLEMSAADNIIVSLTTHFPLNYQDTYQSDHNLGVCLPPPDSLPVSRQSEKCGYTVDLLIIIDGYSKVEVPKMIDGGALVL
jgi:hypothetical protein